MKYYNLNMHVMLHLKYEKTTIRLLYIYLKSFMNENIENKSKDVNQSF